MLETSHGQSNETAYVIQLYMDTVHEKKRRKVCENCSDEE